MSGPEHLTNGSIVRMMDGELTGDESLAVRSHLASCEACARRYGQFYQASKAVKTLVLSIPAEDRAGARTDLADMLGQRSASWADRRSPGKFLGQLGWIAAVAAMLTVGVLLVPRVLKITKRTQPALSETQVLHFDIDGETFIALPYSNSDLPVSVPRVVEMQVPVSSLASAGISFEPVTSGAPLADRTVLADVALGGDGQPLGVHVLSFE